MESDSARSTILIVDDDLAILEYAGGVLEEYGYAVLTASNAASALVMLRSNEGIDLLFTDLVMPGFDGIELARRAGEEIPGLKVLFTTGYSTDPAPNGRLLGRAVLAGRYRRDSVTADAVTVDVAADRPV